MRVQGTRQWLSIPDEDEEDRAFLKYMRLEDEEFHLGHDFLVEFKRITRMLVFIKVLCFINASTLDFILSETGILRRSVLKNLIYLEPA